MTYKKATKEITCEDDEWWDYMLDNDEEEASWEEMSYRKYPEKTDFYDNNVPALKDSERDEMEEAFLDAETV